MLSSLHRKDLKGLMPFYEKIAEKCSQWHTELFPVQTPLYLSISGPQGSGKSTLAEALPILLDEKYNLHADGFSLDDVYLTKAERETLSKNIHRLLITRGVPGTHDLALAENTIHKLISGKGRIPLFDKGNDDRFPEQAWRNITKPCDIVIVEGWCMGCPPEDSENLYKPVNTLEKEEDPGCTWREYVNNALRTTYSEFFRKFHYSIWLQPPSFEKVFDWRLLQEQKLKKKDSKAQNIMDRQTLSRFIGHYERLTLHMMKVLPTQASIVIMLGDKHEITEVIFRDKK